MTRPRVVLFDIGETLWSSPPEDPQALADCYGRGRDVLVRALGDVPSIETLVDAVEGYFAEWETKWRNDPALVEQRPTTDFVAEALARIGVTPPADALADFTAALLETSIYTAQAEAPEPDMVEAMAALKDLGVRIGCVSNAFMTASDLHRIMEQKGLGQFLELTVSSCEAGFRKPHPAIYQAALDGFDIEASEAIFVGDRIYADVEGPSKLGMRTVLTTQYRREEPDLSRVRPDLIIAHLRELAPWVQGLLKDGS
jgi:HAD superfamily hydrolase (TIGR01549 family)